MTHFMGMGSPTYINRGFFADKLSNERSSLQTRLGSAASRIVDETTSRRGETRVATSTRWPARIRSGIVSKITDMNVVLLFPPLNLATSLLNRNPSATPTA